MQTYGVLQPRFHPFRCMFFCKVFGSRGGTGEKSLPGGCRMSLFRTARAFESLNTMVIGVDWFQDVSNLFI